jgi:hypothetical protein
MALLDEESRAAVWTQHMRDNAEAYGSMTKLELRAAVDAADSWVDSQQASFNSAIPLPARTSLSTKQKALLLMYVVQKRYITQ